MRVGLALLTLALAGCAPTPVDVQIGFPSTETFLYSEFGRLFVYELDAETGLGECPTLLEAVGRGALGDPVLDSSWQPICSFRSGGVSFAHVPPGPHAYVAVARDQSNTILLSGCRIAEAYEGAPPVQLELFPTSAYARAVDGVTLTCGSVEDKCTRGGCR